MLGEAAVINENTGVFSKGLSQTHAKRISVKPVRKVKRSLFGHANPLLNRAKGPSKLKRVSFSADHALCNVTNFKSE